MTNQKPVIRGDAGRFNPSLKAYLILVAILAVLAGISVFLPQGDAAAQMAAQGQGAMKPSLQMALFAGGIMLVLYGPLGLLGWFLSRKLGFAEIVDPRVTNRQRYLTPALIGSGLGVFFVIMDQIFARFHTLGPLPHPPFPTSIFASATAGIGEEIIFRLFFVSLWTWLISSLILRGRFQTPVFWVVTALSAVAFSFGHMPSLMILLGIKDMSQIGLIPTPIMIEVFLLNGSLSFAAAYYFRKYGFLAAVGIHFWADVIWHVIWGLVAVIL